jgi:hypothetical protein
MRMAGAGGGAAGGSAVKARDEESSSRTRTRGFDFMGRIGDQGIPLAKPAVDEFSVRTI